jgi:hypothetical protein
MRNEAMDRSRILGCIAMIFCLWCTHLASAQVRASQASDYTPAEEEYRDVLNALPNDLHKYPVQFDGTKGYVTGHPVEEGPYPSQPMAPFINEREASLHRVFCSPVTQAVVLAQMIASESKLSSSRNSIFTRYAFSVQSIVTEDPKINIHKTVYVVDLGGTVKDDGDTLKVRVKGSVAWKNGDLYLLALRHATSAPPDVFFFGPQIEVRGGRVYPSNAGALGLATTGERLQDVEERFARSLLRKPCY